MSQADYPHRVAIGLGSNLGDSCAILAAALAALAATPGIAVLKHSPFYQTKAVGPPQPDFVNACAILATDLLPQAVLQQLLAIEAQFGRVRRQRWGPRLLDLDLLLFDHEIIKEPHLQVPHPRMMERAFVLVPLANVAADWLDPVSGRAIAELVKQVDCSEVRVMS
jgi:2-amino-4-hydroxy-6-hydroxymethyldihydropteridine diphosphokinase